MAIYTVRFEEQGGFTVQTRIRAPADAAHATLAAQKIFGRTCYWEWVRKPEGQVLEQVGDWSDPARDRPRLGLTRVTVYQGRRRG